MGGINHQPTKRKLTAASAWLSQRFCRGFTHVLRANDALEDALITSMAKLYVEDVTADLEGTPGEYMRTAISELGKSVAAVEQSLLAYDNILEAANKEGYKGNTLARQVRSMNLVASFEGKILQPSIQTSIWEEIERRISEENTLGVLKWEQTQVRKVVPLIEDLIQVMSQCLTVAEEKGHQAFANAIEMNELPLRQKFACVFSYWGYLQTMFLYAAIMMTELFYQENKYPSLVGND